MLKEIRKEGLLKQRIEDLKAKAVKALGVPMIIDKELYEVLDECKQGYHFGMPMIFLSENPSKEEIQKAFALLEKTLNDKDEWFLRNFGLPVNGYPSENQLKRFSGTKK